MNIPQQTARLMEALSPELQAHVLHYVEQLAQPAPDPRFPRHIQPGPAMTREE